MSLRSWWQWRGAAGGQADPLLRAAVQDAVPQTVSAVHAAFDALMDVLEAQQALAERGRPHPAAAAAAAAMGGQSALAFQEATAAELMALGAQAEHTTGCLVSVILGRCIGIKAYLLVLKVFAHRTQRKGFQPVTASVCDARSACLPVNVLSLLTHASRTCLLVRRIPQGTLRAAACADVPAGGQPPARAAAGAAVGDFPGAQPASCMCRLSAYCFPLHAFVNRYV